MEPHPLVRPLLVVGIVGLVVTILFTMFFGPHSASRIEGRVQAAADAALAGGGFAWAVADAHGQKVVIEGVAPSPDARLAASQAVLRSMGPGGVLAGGVTKVAFREAGTRLPANPSSAPAEWIATLSNGRLVLNGRAPSAEAQRDLTVAAGAATAGVEDRTRVGGAGAWQARAIAALPHFTRFQSGEISVSDRIFRISGTASGSRLGYLREDMERISDGYDVIYDVKEIAPFIAEIEGVDLGGAGEDKQLACQTAFTRIMADNSILFGTGDAAISRDSGAVLDKLVEVARRCSELRIEIQGYTDSTGRPANNRALSQKRADAVRAYFETQGVPAAQLRAVGYGPDKPAATNRTERGRAQNRRIEFQVSSAEGR